MKASDEKSSRCDHENGNQYTYLLIVVEGMGKRNPHQVGKAEKIPKGFLFDIVKLALKMIDLYISRFTEKRRRTVVTVQGLTGLKKTDGVNWETVKAIGFLYPNILDTLSNIFSGSSKRIKTSMLMHWQR